MSRNYNFWFDTYPPVKDNNLGIIKNVDTLVIGGGISGISLLYYLLSSGLSNTYLVEENMIADHATGRSHGQSLLRGTKLFSEMPEQDGINYLSFIFENNKRLLHGLRNFSFDTDLQESGGLRLASSEEEFAKLIRESEFIRKHKNIDCPIMSRNDVNHIIPSNKFFGGMFVPCEFKFNPFKVACGLKEVIEKTGQRILMKSRVESVIMNDDDTISVAVRHKGTIKAKQIVYCNGAYANTLLPELSNILTPFRGQMLSTDFLPINALDVLPAMSISCNNAQDYIRLYGSRLLVGGLRQSVKGQQENIVFDGDISPTVYENLKAFALNLFPELVGVKFSCTWSSIMANTPDGMPLIGPLPGRINQYIMSGLDAFGFSHVILGSEVIKNYICGQFQSQPASDLFKPDRFKS